MRRAARENLWIVAAECAQHVESWLERLGPTIHVELCTSLCTQTDRKVYVSFFFFLACVIRKSNRVGLVFLFPHLALSFVHWKGFFWWRPNHVQRAFSFPLLGAHAIKESKSSLSPQIGLDQTQPNPNLT